MEQKKETITIEREVTAIDYREKRTEVQKKIVVNESLISININNNPFVNLLILPEQIKELSLGHLKSEGIIDSIEEVKNIEIKENNVNIVTLKDVEFRIKTHESIRVISSGCGSSSSTFLTLLDKLKDRRIKEDNHSIVETKTILNIARSLNKLGVIWRSTGGTHIAALFNFFGDLINYAEDIGRHNAIDKVIGGGLLKNTKFSETILASSGRQSVDMISKISRVGIPLVISLSAPTEWGIKIAERVGITLILAKEKIYIFTNPHRVNLSN